MKYIDLFAGAGGLSIGFEQEPFDLILANEYDKSASNTYRYNHKTYFNQDLEEWQVISAPIERIVNDILGVDVVINFKKHSVTLNTVKEAYRKNDKVISSKNAKEILTLNNQDIDLIIGGPPCQGFSLVGRGKRGTKEQRLESFIDDPRNQLFKQFIAFVKYYTPKYVLIENVKGILSSGDYADEISETLAESGYKCKRFLLNSSEFGVPQSRERVFFLGISTDYLNRNLKNSDETFQTFITHLNSLKKNQKTTVFDAIGDLPKIIANPKRLNTKSSHEIPISEKNSFGETISTKSYSELLNVNNDYIQAINVGKHRIKITPKKLYNHKSRYQNERDLEIYKRLHPGVYLDHVLNEEAKKLVTYNVSTFNDKYYKLDWNKPSKTIVAHLAMDNNGFVHPGLIPRGITPREAARLQSFPDYYYFEGPLSHQFKQIGNAVPPMLGRALAKSIYLTDLHINNTSNTRVNKNKYIEHEPF
jgi:DNA (cytosine-5)-methyltransferase 1